MQCSRTMAVYCLLEVFLLISVLALAKGSCENCATCQGSNTCLLCNHGYYMSNGICRLCQDNCENCYNETACAQCFVGFYLDADTGSCHACRTACKSCDSYDVCRICEDKYFEQNGECLTCPIACSTCLSSTHCTSCYLGHWGSTNCSNNCPGGCKNSTCDVQGLCVECPDGTYGTRCQHACPGNCITSICSLSGSCTEGCVPGSYGNACETSCPANCQSSVCSENGRCTTGCNAGFYGDYCNKTCLSTTCPYSECFQNNGSCKTPCPETCLSCTSLISCTSCKQGHYGTMCENRCSHDNCKECTQETGTCLKCNNGHFLSSASCIPCSMECATCEGTTSSNCLSCVKGYYLDGNQCKTCNDGCSDCSRYDNCNECQDGYFLETSECTKCPQNCKTCTSTNICTSCFDGYQGITCNSFVCADQKYSTSLGTDSCECDKQKCSNKNGATCQSCTDSGWYPSGPGCCPCADGTYENNGACIKCPEHCIPKGQCNVSTDACIEGCENRWWGLKCDQKCNDTCESCPRDGTCNQSIAGGVTDPTTTPAALPAKGDTNRPNTVIIAAAGGGGAVFLIVIIVVVIICVVRRKTTPKTRGKEQSGDAAQITDAVVDNHGADEEETVYTDNDMYASLPETQTAAKAHTTQYDNRFSLENEYSTTTVDTGQYSFVDKSGSKTGRRLDSQRNRKDTSPSAANNSTNETSDIGHDSIVDKYRYEMAMGSDAVYSVPNKKSKVKQSENL